MFLTHMYVWTSTIHSCVFLHVVDIFYWKFKGSHQVPLYSDDVADHRKWAEQLKCERIIHSGDVRIASLAVSFYLT